ncbi:transketolase [Consotaella aegiceratis]|uniref:transketolase n=1 Tax=Consotaella aegiceratis TaxID=3097961 RepID=UPI002F3EA23C
MSAIDVHPDILTLMDGAYEIRRLVVEMAHQPEGAHLGGALSAAEILSVLFGTVLRLDPSNPEWPDRDYFVLSKGHIAAAYYAALMKRGFIPEAELGQYAQNGSRLGGHPSHNLPGVEFSTGSLGHGLSLGIGLALAARHLGKPNRTFVLMGDGELQEGTIWEAAGSAGRFDLGALTAIIDRNGLQINGSVESWLGDDNLAQRWKSFGWDVIECDGHSVAELLTVLSPSRHPVGVPHLVIARTVKAKGIPFMENDKRSHSVVLSEKAYQRAIAALKASRQL